MIEKAGFYVPVVDIAAFRAGGHEDRVRVARAFGDALERVGFVTITGHGVDPELIDATYRAVAEFFALPYAEKLRANPPEQVKMRGYLPVGIESVAATLDARAPADLCEALVFAGLSRRAPRPNALPNLWPGRPERLRDLVTRYDAAMVALGRQLVRLSALALDLPEDHLDAYFDEPGVTLRFVNYPDQPDPPLAGQLRYGAHHDYGGLTILRQDSAPGGLQVCDPQGTWHDVPPSGDGFVINVGDLMSRWTNGRWRSTLHRVINPPRDLTGSTRRLSMVQFFSPNENSEIACLATCASATNPAKWPPVIAGEWVKAKLDKSMKLQAAVER
jgi:isopenicillin N synthase-like dioxygenase